MIRWKSGQAGPWENPPAIDYSPHGSALRIARRCLFIIRACLREEEWDDALQEFYQAAREELESSLEGSSH
jgi:hypothetical protein